MLSWSSMAIYQGNATHLGTPIPSHQLVEPLWTDPGLQSETGTSALISKKKKKAQAGNE